jgi:hypothetical protein
MPNYYSRYELSNSNGLQKTLPFIKILESPTDIYIPWEETKSRMDIISDNYYSSPLYGWFIMAANPQFGAMEYDIPNNSIIRIPYPLENALKDYFNQLKNNGKLN